MTSWVTSLQGVTNISKAQTVGLLCPIAKAILPRLATCIFSKAENLWSFFTSHPVFEFVKVMSKLLSVLFPGHGFLAKTAFSFFNDVTIMSSLHMSCKYWWDILQFFSHTVVRMVSAKGREKLSKFVDVTTKILSVLFFRTRCITCSAVALHCVKARRQSQWRSSNRPQAFEWYQFEWPWMTSNPVFKVTILFNVI